MALVDKRDGYILFCFVKIDMSKYKPILNVTDCKANTSWRGAGLYSSVADRTKWMRKVYRSRQYIYIINVNVCVCVSVSVFKRQ